MSKGSGGALLTRIKPSFYIHVLDTNTSLTRLVTGPYTFTRAAHETVVEGPTPMVAIPPRSYCIVQNPAVRPANDPIGEPHTDDAGQVRLRHGVEQIRLGKTDAAGVPSSSASQWTSPFALYPGEQLSKAGIVPLQVVNADCALLLSANTDFVDAGGVARAAGSEWLWNGPGTYIPSVDVTVLEVIKSIVIHENTALKLRARRGFTDRAGVAREAGAEWLYRKTGAFLPAVEEEVLGVVKATVLTAKRALHLRAAVTFTDVFNKRRRAGDEWLVTSADAPTHIPDVHEQVVADVGVTTLNSRQYCVVLNPVLADGSQRVGQKALRRGECSFFLKPGESLESGIQNVIVLSEDEALLLSASQDFTDTGTAATAPPTGSAAAKSAATSAAAAAAADGGGGKKSASSTTTTTTTSAAAAAKKPGSVKRVAGEKWMVYGPCDFTPPIEVTVVAKRKAIPLDQNEGVYVRNLKTGRVTAVVGHSYMLGPEEELWEKALPPHVEALLAKQGRDPNDGGKGGGGKAAAAAAAAADGGAPARRDPTRVVTYRAPHNSAVQIYDYKKHEARVVLGPDLALLQPNEEFTVLSLSGGTPKKANQIDSLALLLGPDFMTDVVLVETSDHARLSLKLSYNWHFEVGADGDEGAAQQLFSVADFVGDTCKAVASLVRSAVAATSFDEFHKHSARIIRSAAFGVDERNKVRDRLVFVSNRLVISNIDIQSVEPVDQRTRDALQKSVQLAIEITTKSQEATARHEAERLEQEARGRLERQKITDAADAEKARKQLVSLQAQSMAVEAEGEAKAAATAEADAALISGQASLKSAELRARAIRIKSEVQIAELKDKTEQELVHQAKLDALEVARAKELAHIELEKFTRTVKSLGPDVLAEIAQSGPKAQAELLASLGISATIITDGSSPISLLDTAKGLVAQPGGAAGAQ